MPRFNSIPRALLWALLAVGMGVLPVLGRQTMTQGHRADRRNGNFWRERAHKKVMEDSLKLVELSRELREEAEKHNPLTQPVLERIATLGDHAAELREMIENLDENFLSLPALKKAEGVQAEAKSLEETLEASPARKELKRLRRLAGKIEKRAKSVADNMRSP